MRYKKILFSIALVLISWLLINVAVAQLNLPPGEYQNSCYGCTLINGRLDCFCKNQHGFPQHTSIMVRQGVDIVNNDGQLQYVRHHHNHRHWPPYPYRRGVLRNVKAGPIWNQTDAESKCPDICRNAGGEWTGQWHTTKWARQSVCECRLRRYY